MSSKEAAVSFFQQFQAHLVSISVRQRIAIVVPDGLREAVDAQFLLPDGESILRASSWPKTSILPKMVDSTGAWLYPEHDCVLLAPVFSVKPTYQLAVKDIVGALEESVASTSFTSAPQSLLLFAAANYTHAAQSTQWVWSFLLALMTLDMLAAGARGKKKEAVVLLVQKYCAPGVSINPRLDLFTDPHDCKSKVAGMYDLRSQYIHEGHVPANKQGLPSFFDAHKTALQSLAHIIQEKHWRQVSILQSVSDERKGCDDHYLTARFRIP
ncbi:hypothetical protein [Cupriavidus sp. H39]|uniref:hypothetical protein n=1 Tax=Cupriavidus sp. H39 TaxID=3401635 RepID=UPI003CFEF827